MFIKISANHLLRLFFIVETAIFKPTIHDAVSKNRFQKVKFLVEKKNHQVIARNKDSETPLHIAARRGNVKIAKYLLKHKSDINAVDGFKETPIYEAIRFNKEEAMIKFLVTSGACIDKENYIGESPLRMAIRLNKFDIFKFLFKKGKRNVRKKDKGLRQLFELAVNFNRIDVLSFLIKKGLDINKKNKDDITPFSYAIHNKFSEREIIFHLIYNGAWVRDIHYKNISWPLSLYLDIAAQYDKSENKYEYFNCFIKEKEKLLKSIRKEQKNKKACLNFAIYWTDSRIDFIKRLLFCRSLQAFEKGYRTIEKNPYYKFCRHKKRNCVKNIETFTKHVKKRAAECNLAFAKKYCSALRDYAFHKKLYKTRIIRKGPASPDLKIIFN